MPSSELLSAVEAEIIAHGPVRASRLFQRLDAAAARPPLQQARRPDAPGTDVSFQPTDAPISTPQMLFDALKTNNV